MGFGIHLPGPFSVYTSGRAGKYAKKHYELQKDAARQQQQPEYRAARWQARRARALAADIALCRKWADEQAVKAASARSDVMRRFHVKQARKFGARLAKLEAKQPAGVDNPATVSDRR